jgi:hypothetical protein
MFDHWSITDWRRTLGDLATLNLDKGDGMFIVDERTIPVHLESRMHRALKRFMHGLGIWP